jgi:hypothetical protein
MPHVAPAPYLPAPWAQRSDQQHGLLGQQLIQSSASIQTHSVDDAPFAPTVARSPVLIFEPGLGNVPTQYTTLLEDLASHGYTIFALTPTYSAQVVVFPDGRVATATPRGNPQSDSPFLLSVWTADVRFVLTQVSRLASTPGTPFRGHLDLARVGVFGHSFGGATAAEVCHDDRRCVAGADLDGYLTGAVVQTGLRRPFLVLQSDPGSCADSGCRTFQRDIRAMLRTVPRGAAASLRIRGMAHFNFSDYAVMFSPLRALGLLGSIDGVRGLQITRTYVRAFFDTYLAGRPSLLWRGPAPAFPEVRVAPSS